MLAAIRSGPLCRVGILYSEKWPVLLRCPILFAANSVNQTPLKSVSPTIPSGPLRAVGTAYSLITPEDEIRPILLPVVSEKYVAVPPLPRTIVISPGPQFGVGILYSVILPSAASRPILLALISVNHASPKSSQHAMAPGSAARVFNTKGDIFVTIGPHAASAKLIARTVMREALRNSRPERLSVFTVLPHFVS